MLDLDHLETKCGLREAAHPLLDVWCRSKLRDLHMSAAHICTAVCKHCSPPLSRGDAKKAAVCKAEDLIERSAFWDYSVEQKLSFCSPGNKSESGEGALLEDEMLQMVVN